MAFPAEMPGYSYTDPMDFHDDPVYVVHGPDDARDYNHALDVRGNTGPVTFWEAFDANGSLTEQLGGPHPPFDAATDCIWSKINKGRTLDGPWGGVCLPVDDGPSADRSGGHGSGWEASTPLSDTLGIQIAHASVTISGWAFRPWKIFAAYTNQWMDDPALEAEVAAITAPDGWFTEWEAFHPIFVGYQIAPDESTTIPLGARTEPVTWLYDPVGGWNFYGVDPDDSIGIWATGATPDGTVLTDYDGGVDDWMDPPGGWPVAVQVDDRFTCAFEAPDDDLDGLEPLTLASEALYPGGGVPDYNGSGGRDHQFLLTRAIWRTPQYRFYHEDEIIPNVIRQYPRDDAQGWGSGTRLYPPTKADRTVGGIQ